MPERLKEGPHAIGLRAESVLPDLAKAGVTLHSSGSVELSQLAASYGAALVASHRAHSEVHAVLAKQVEGAIETADHLVDAVVREANNTHQSAASLVQFMGTAVRDAEQAFSSVRQAIDQTHQERLALERQATRLEAATNATRKMLEEQRRLESIGERAHNLGMRIRIVAMNTTIQSTQGSTSQGGVITVLAREISNLASEVQRLGLELTDSVKALSDHLDREVIHGVSAEANATAQIGHMLAGHVETLRTSYHHLTTAHREVWEHVMDSGRQVAQYACDTLGGLQYQDIARQRLEQVSRVLARIISCDQTLTSALLGEAPLPPDWQPVHAAQLLKEYVMASQRSVHQAHAATPVAAPDGPAIELF